MRGHAPNKGHLGKANNTFIALQKVKASKPEKDEIEALIKQEDANAERMRRESAIISTSQQPQQTDAPIQRIKRAALSGLPGSSKTKLSTQIKQDLPKASSPLPDKPSAPLVLHPLLTKMIKRNYSPI